MGERLDLLVVDDDDAVREAVTRQLERLGHRVTAVNGGAEALRALESETCDLALIDLMMPEMDGHELIAALKERGALPPFIMISGDPEPMDVIMAFRAGAGDFLLKPVSRVELGRALSRAIARTRLSSESTGSESTGAEPAGSAKAGETKGSVAEDAEDSAKSKFAPSDRVKLLNHLRRGEVRSAIPAGTVQLVWRLYQKAEPDPEEVFALLESDPMLSQTVIRLAQSPRYRGKTAPTSTRDAAVRIGASRALSAASSVANRMMYDTEQRDLGRFIASLWLTHFLVSLMAEELCVHSGLPGRHLVQSLALFMSVGEVVSTRAAFELWPDRFDEQGRPNPELEALISSVQAEVGAKTLELWKMPAAHVFIARHHAGTDTTGVPPELAAPLFTCRLARSLVAERMMRYPLGGSPPLGQGERALLARIGDERVGQAANQAKERVRDIMSVA